MPEPVVTTRLDLILYVSIHLYVNVTRSNIIINIINGNDDELHNHFTHNHFLYLYSLMSMCIMWMCSCPEYIIYKRYIYVNMNTIQIK